MKKLAVVNRDICVACGACVKACTRGALTIHKGCYAVVDSHKCVGCGLCGKTCPAGCVETRERSTAK